MYESIEGVHVNQMRAGPLGRVDWGLSDCFPRKRAIHSIALLTSGHCCIVATIVFVMLSPSSCQTRSALQLNSAGKQTLDSESSCSNHLGSSNVLLMWEGF